MKLNNCVEVLSGFAFKSGLFNTEGKGLPIIRIRDVTSNSVSTYYDGKYKDEYIVSNGDLLVGMDGQFKLIEWQGGKALLNQRVCKLIPNNKKADKDFIKFLVPKSLKEIEDRTSFVTVKHLTVKKIKEIELPSLHIEAQQKISSILDDAAALSDKTAQLLTEYDLLAQSIFLEMFGDPAINQKNWNTLSLKKLTSKIGSGSTPRGGKEAYKKVGMSLIRSLNIHDNKFKMKNLALIDDNQANKLKNVSIEKDDVLINITGASVARCAIVPEKILPARVNQHVSILRCKKEQINPVFLLHLLISSNCKIKLLGVGSSNAATRESITKEQLQNFEIIVPPIDLQTQFAQKIALIEQQKALAKQELKESEDLFNCLLQKAFKGELA